MIKLPKDNQAWVNQANLPPLCLAAMEVAEHLHGDVHPGTGGDGTTQAVCTCSTPRNKTFSLGRVLLGTSNIQGQREQQEQPFGL